MSTDMGVDRGSTRRDALRRLRTATAGNRFAAVLAMLVVLFLFFGVTQERFLTGQNLENLLTSVSILWVVAIGMTFVLLTGGFDLSVGSALALAGLILAALYNDLNLPAVVAVALTLVAGACIGGALNGFLIGKLGLSFLVVTLGSLSLLRGIVNIWSDTKSDPVNSKLVEHLGIGEWLGLPIPVWIMLGTFLVTLYVLRSTYFGRDVYATGGNADAARVSGIRVPRTLIAVYAISGMCAALAGILQVGRIGAASPLVGENVMLDAGAAVLLGGTSFHGGIGGVGGTVVGVLFIGVLQNGLAISGVAPFWQQVVSGAVLILAVLIDKIQREGWASIGVRFSSRRRGADGEQAALDERG